MKKILMVSALVMLAMTAQAQQASELLCTIYSPAERDLQRERVAIKDFMSEEIQLVKNNFVLTAYAALDRISMTIETPERASISQEYKVSRADVGAIVSVTEASGNELSISCQLVY